MSIKPSFTFYAHILIHCFVNIIQGNVYNKSTEKIVDLSKHKLSGKKYVL